MTLGVGIQSRVEWKQLDDNRKSYVGCIKPRGSWSLMMMNDLERSIQLLQGFWEPMGHFNFWLSLSLSYSL